MTLVDRRSILVLAVSCVVAGGAAEIGLRLGTTFPIHGSRANRQADPRLGYRMDPRLRGIDSYGFRNAARPARSDIVALGDSHTFGYNVDAEQTWPNQLSRRTGLSVYNLGIGGYGVYQYRALLSEALSLRPRTVIVALYVMNDAADLCASQTYVTDRRAWEDITRIPWNACVVDQESRRSDRNDLSDWTASRSALVSLVRWAYGEFRMQRILNSGGDAARGQIVVRDAQGGRYLFQDSTTRGRARLVDLDNRTVRLGMSQLRAFFGDARQELQAADIQLAVLYVPIRERVFADPLARLGHAARFAAMLDGEANLRQSVDVHLRELGVPRVDAFPDVMAAQAAGERVYPDGEDDHPTAAGYRAYAQAVQRILTGS